MRKLFTLIFMCVQLLLHAQTTPESTILYYEGLDYLRGVQKRYDPQQAKSCFLKSAKLGNALSMMSLADIYLAGKVGRSNLDSAIYWYKESAKAGNSGAYFSIGNIYKYGILSSPDFKLAVKYFTKGTELNNEKCKYMLAYMTYKGLGTEQSYTTAYPLFKELAEKEDVSSMYFLGLCLRNGYGTSVDAESAKKWLMKAAEMGDIQAKRELAETLPENVSAVNEYLQNQLSGINSYNEKFKPSIDNNYEGKYIGYAVYFDWSGRYVSEILPLALELKKINGGYEGYWKEGQDSSSAIKIRGAADYFTFDKSSFYLKTNHYSGRSPEKWRFNDAKLDLRILSDSIQLTGMVQFYSSKRNEPGKPMRIILKKGIDESGMQGSSTFINLFPNPAKNTTTLRFQINKTQRISFTVSSLDGKIMYMENEQLLQAGTYTYNLPVRNFLPGTYLIQLYVNGKANGTKKLIKL